jgi:hypothetical protein
MAYTADGHPACTVCHGALVWNASPAGWVHEDNAQHIRATYEVDAELWRLTKPALPSIRPRQV